MDNYNFNEMSNRALEIALLEDSILNKKDHLKKLLETPETRSKIDTDCMFICLIYLSQHDDLELFNLMQKSILKDGKHIEREVYEKTFNSLCNYNQLETLKALDKSLDLSGLMMIDSLSIDEEKLMDTDYNDPDSLSDKTLHHAKKFSYKNQLAEIWPEHGFLAASHNGYTEMVDYLLSTPTIMTIPLKLIEAGFIVACKREQYDTALAIYPKIGGINKSHFIQDYIRSNEDEEIKQFLAKLVFEEMNNELPKNDKADKRIKI